MKKRLLSFLMLIIIVFGDSLPFPAFAVSNGIRYLLSKDTCADLNWEAETITVFSDSDGVSYPRMYTLNDGTIICGFDRKGAVEFVKSTDDGKTWSDTPITIHSEDNLACANASFIQLENSDILCAYRATGLIEGRFYACIKVSVSKDNGFSWADHSTVIETYQNSDNFNGVWEPHFGYIGNKLAVFYSNDSQNDAVESPEHQNIEFKLWEGERWSEKHIASSGKATNSRDGMHVWQRTLKGDYIMTMESTAFRNKKDSKAFVVQLLKSENGLNWSKPKTIYYPINADYAGAPYVVQLPDGRLSVLFQTNEDGFWTQRIITTKNPYNGKETAASFTKPFSPFGNGDNSCFGGMHLHKDFLLTFTSNDKSIILRRAKV